jgi:hypothetical protein
LRSIPKYIDQTLVEEENDIIINEIGNYVNHLSLDENNSHTSRSQVAKSSSPKAPKSPKSPKIHRHRAAAEDSESLTDKDRIKEMVLERKMKHDKRIQVLEKLIKMEKTHAHKLRKILKLSQEDTFMCDSLLDKLDQSVLDDLNMDEFKDQNTNLLDKNLDEILREQLQMDSCDHLAAQNGGSDENMTSSRVKIPKASIKKSAELVSRLQREEKKEFERSLDKSMNNQSLNQSHQQKQPVPKPTSWFFPVDQPVQINGKI